MSMENLRHEIESCIEALREDYLKDLSRLVAVDSVRGEESLQAPYGSGPAKALETALEIAEGYGFYTENWENRLGIVQLYGGAERKLDILAHLDVVAPGAGWTVCQPFSMKVCGDQVFGRGVADDKGPALSALYAMRAIRELGLPLQSNVRLMLGCDEESGSSDLKYYLSKTAPAEMTFSPDGTFPVINLEKGLYHCQFSKTCDVPASAPALLSLRSGTAVNVIPASAEAIVTGLSEAVCAEAAEMLMKETQITCQVEALDGHRLCLKVYGRSGHASMPDEAVNACTAMLNWLYMLPFSNETSACLHRLFPHGDTHGRSAGIYQRDDLSGEISVCLNVLEIEDGFVKGKIDCRTPLTVTREHLEPLRQALLASGFSLQENFKEAHYVSADTPFVKTLLAHYENWFEKPGVCRAIGGETYCHGIPNAVAFGCATADLDNRMHGPDEVASVTTLLQSSKLFASVIAACCG